MSKNKYDIKQENKNGTNKMTINEYHYSLDDLQQNCRIRIYNKNRS